jgi:tagatose 6-phosphate kinase
MILTVTLKTGFDGRAVGSGIEVARVLHALGHETMVTGFVDGETGAAIRMDVLAAGLRESLFDLVGDRVTISDWADFVGGFHALAARASVVVLSGELPDGLPVDAYAQLIRATSTPVVLDTSGEPLLAGVAARPAVVVPNTAGASHVAAITVRELDAHADR